MIRFFLDIYQICCFKKGPQDLAFSYTSLLYALLCLFLVIAAIDSYVATEQQNLLYAELVDLFTVAIFISLVLNILKKSNRFLQSMTAVVGIECWLNLFLLLAVIVLVQDVPTLSLIVASAILYFWRLSVLCHVFKEMLSADYMIALLLTVTFEMFRIIMMVSFVLPGQM